MNDILKSDDVIPQCFKTKNSQDNTTELTTVNLAA